MIGLTDTEFAWTMAGLAGIALTGVIAYANRRRTDEPEAEGRARDFVLRDHPDDTDDEVWAPWDVALIARGICPVHVPALIGSGDCNDDCPTAISKDVADAAMDALTDNVLHGTPLPTQAAVWAEAFAAQPTGPCPVHQDRTHGDCPRCQATTPRRAEPDADWMWRVPSGTGFTSTPPEETRANLKAAFADPAGRDNLVPAMDLDDLRALVREQQAADRRQAEPQVRYLITRPAIGWDNHEGTKGEWIRLECEFGLRHDNPGPDAQPVVDRIAWNGAVMGRIVRPWTDPNDDLDPDLRRANLAAVAADVEQHLGVEPDHDDTIPVSPWDTKPAGFGQAVPVQNPIPQQRQESPWH
jgi:hypothetical protein